MNLDGCVNAHNRTLIQGCVNLHTHMIQSIHKGVDMLVCFWACRMFSIQKRTETQCDAHQGFLHPAFEGAGDDGDRILRVAGSHHVDAPSRNCKVLQKKEVLRMARMQFKNFAQNVRKTLPRKFCPEI